MPILAPAVPYTPPIWSALPKGDQPVFYYRAPHAAFDAYCEEYAEWCAREKARTLSDALADLRETLTDDSSATPAARVRRKGIEIQIAETEAEIARLPEPYTETEMLDAAASMFGHVLLRVDVGDESHTYPSDHTERVAWLKDLPFMAVAQLAHAVRNQAYRSESLGK